jgi:hypothetical protein
VLKHEVDRFVEKLVEGSVYEISSFYVAPNCGNYRTTLHSFRIVFNSDTVVSNSHSDSIPLYGLSLVTTKEIYTHCRDFEFLVGIYSIFIYLFLLSCYLSHVISNEINFIVDVLGYLTGITREQQIFVDGKVTKAFVVELIDERYCIIFYHKYFAFYIMSTLFINIIDVYLSWNCYIFFAQWWNWLCVPWRWRLL